MNYLGAIFENNNVFSWTSTISNHGKMGQNELALLQFIEMQRMGVNPNEKTFSIVIGISTKLQRLDFGMSLHCLILRMGLFRQHFVTTGLVTLYCKCDVVNDARKLFDESLERDVVMWNAMIAGYSQKGLYEEAVGVFFDLLNSGSDWRYLVNDFTFASSFRGCAGLGCVKIGKALHSCAIKTGFDSDVFVAGSTVDMYSKCGSVDIARRVFDRMGRRDLVVWNSMITGYTQNHYGWEVIELFQLLQIEGFAPNETTFCCALKASSIIDDSIVGRCFHAKALISGCCSDVFVGTSLVDMYSKYFEMEEANRAFQDMTRRNLVSFNALINGYSLTGRCVDALQTYMNLFSENLRPDSFTFGSLLSSCSECESLIEGTQIHACAFKVGLDSHVTVGNSLVSLYAKCGLMESASQSFKSLAAPNAVSWAGIISAYAQNGDNKKALEYFYKLNKLSAEADEFSLSSILKVLANCAAVVQGKHVHALVIKKGVGLSLYVGSALIDMYAKCGMIDDSFQVFHKIPEKNVVVWNSMIVAYAQNGYSDKSLLLFQEMVRSSVIPTSITFTGILHACSHAGLVEKGKQYYNSMVSTYKIPPSVEHCTCMVDLLGRSGYLDDAESFLRHCPFSTEPGLWRALLTSCGVHKNVDVAVRAAKQCIRLEPNDSSAYVTLSNIYASKELWNEVTRIRDMMRVMGVEKNPGCSWIEVSSKGDMSVEIFNSNLDAANYDTDDRVREDRVLGV
ncbi:hypothetical protein ACHQM5_013151 [Ranunculus cassubicifolius]